MLTAHRSAPLLIAGQAPGSRVHATGIPWDDPSGDRLRDWLGLDRETFYRADRVALVPMGFCYPGAGKSGDLPPRPECARDWHPRLLPLLRSVRLTIVIGTYAQAYHLGDRRRESLTATVAAWREYLPAAIPLPHPSPRNRIWLRRNAWFERELVPELQRRVAALGL
ncbi:MAG: uracil-DNA glycosylase family protein [Gemmatimonadales bacterium]